jgi:hypothetical protein
MHCAALWTMHHNNAMHHVLWNMWNHALCIAYHAFLCIIYTMHCVLMHYHYTSCTIHTVYCALLSLCTAYCAHLYAMQIVLYYALMRACCSALRIIPSALLQHLNHAVCIMLRARTEPDALTSLPLTHTLATTLCKSATIRTSLFTIHYEL